MSNHVAFAVRVEFAPRRPPIGAETRKVHRSQHVRCFGSGRKLILKLVVTASMPASPNAAMIATWTLKSAKPNIAGPDSVPPGRSMRHENCVRQAPLCYIRARPNGTGGNDR